ncbi:hypothetical protein E2C01_030664 [Portunus trituberculatus]|uniref:Vitellogenin domain-containing protein n=1 Tax=Portunus trituberculatus TaxID=210409 RepID=A0A5B7ER10_PORTR|nr:hypothetical protein [Portunus trituberculatus]
MSALTDNQRFISAEESQGVQANLQYQYDYTGAISTQLPNDPKQSSGAALRAVVALQLSASGDILVKKWVLNSFKALKNLPE